MKTPKGADYFVMAFHPDDGDEHIGLYNGASEKLEDGTYLACRWLEDLPSEEDQIRGIVADYEPEPEDSAEVIVYALVPVRRYRVDRQKTFRMVLEKGGKK